MSLVVPHAGAQNLLTLLVSSAAFTSAHTHLYTNNIVPSRNSVLTDFTDATWAGSTPLATTPRSQTKLNANNMDVVFNNAVVDWEATGAGLPADNFGVFITANSGALIGASRFDSVPQTVAQAGDFIVTMLTLGLGSVPADPPADQLGADGQCWVIYGALIIGGAADVNHS